MSKWAEIVVAIIAVVVCIGAILYSQDHSVKVTQDTTIQQQPQRERYVPPEWVVNERGQRCIKQGDVITCG